MGCTRGRRRRGRWIGSGASRWATSRATCFTRSVRTTSIGRKTPPLALAANNDCVQRYGEYFNRVVTHEKNPRNVSYVFGSCNTECPAGYLDTAFVPQPLSPKLVSLATDPNASIDLGESRDARLSRPADGDVLRRLKDRYTGVNPHLRTGMQKDSTFEESKAAVRWIVGGIDYWRMYLKMAKIEIYLENGHARMKFVSQTRHSLSADKGYPYRTKSMADWRVQQLRRGRLHQCILRSNAIRHVDALQRRHERGDDKLHPSSAPVQVAQGWRLCARGAQFDHWNSIRTELSNSSIR